MDTLDIFSDFFFFFFKTDSIFGFLVALISIVSTIRKVVYSIRKEKVFSGSISFF